MTSRMQIYCRDWCDGKKAADSDRCCYLLCMLKWSCGCRPRSWIMIVHRAKGEDVYDAA